ncbi:MAG TPA: type III-B CRISPR module RAMP protein Cmr4 [Ktedonobacteraceae bacterium]|nr:type III-B CRISPR module RAMP protein Cmr4 [Ktedonobacteraceae bacterium]
MITQTLYIYTETPLHAGAGSGLSSIDLPIQRERTTQYPMIQGSGIKGKLRASLEGDRESLTPEAREMVDIVFGPPSTSGTHSDHAGALIAGDARLLLFPVRSLNGVFAYTTSYDILSRFRRDIERAQTGSTVDWDIPPALTEQVLVAEKNDVSTDNTIVLEEFSFEVKADPQITKIAKWIASHALPDLGTAYWPEKIKSSLVILPNDVFRDFALYATEVITRVRIDRLKKTVETGALWTEENLPTDTLLYVPLYANKARKKDSRIDEQQVLAQIATLNNRYLQLGGDETVGRGIVRIRVN